MFSSVGRRFSTLEYILPPPQFPAALGGGNNSVANVAPVFLFVLDTALNSNEDFAEFEKAKEVLQQSLESVAENFGDENTVVGFISFGTHVHVHELAYDNDLSKCYALRGVRDWTAAEVY